MKLRLIPALALLILAAPGLVAEEPVTVAVTSLQGPLHLLQGQGGNVVASVGSDGVLLVDDDYGQHAPAYQEALEGLQGKTVRFVLNTHWHGDHTGGNAYWGERGAVVVAHTNVRERMSTRQEMKALGRVIEPSPPAALPVVTFGDSLALHFNGGTIEVQHLPTGHTDGDSVVFFPEENLVHMGDLFFKDRFPFVDIGSGGNVFGFIASVESVLERVDAATTIIPGHGSVANRADLERYHGMLTTTSALVKQRLADGDSVEAITAQGLGEQWSGWGGGFINEAAWISFIAGSL